MAINPQTTNETLLELDKVKSEFTVDPETSRIRNPGKFENEPYYVPYFWDCCLDGAEDEILYDEYEKPYSLFKVEEELAEFLSTDFPGIEDKTVLLWEDDSGFVNHKILDDEELAEFRRECANAAEHSEEL